MFFLVIMALISRMTPLRRWPRIRFVICALLGIAIGLTAILFYAPDKADNFVQSPWLTPTLMFAWLIAIVLVHIRGGGGGGGGPRSLMGSLRNALSLFRWRRKKGNTTAMVPSSSQTPDADSMRLPLRSWKTDRVDTEMSTAKTLTASDATMTRGKSADSEAPT